MGRPCSEETKRKISEAHKKRGTKPPGTKGRRYVMDETWKKKISESLKGERAPWYGKKLSEEHKKKMALFKPGQAPWNKGLGTISSENEKARKTKRARDWRKAVYERDDYTCQDCKTRGGQLHAHHIKPFAQHPGLRYELSNGLTLCEDCHRKTDTWGLRYNMISKTKKETAKSLETTTNIPGWGDTQDILQMLS